jgi:putative acetyltransferase
MLNLTKLERDAMDDVALIHRASFDAALPWLSGLHTPDEDRAYFRDVVFEQCAVWGGYLDGRLVGFVAFRENWIDQLYVLPGFQRRSAGNGLLALAKGAHTPLNLWTFQRNSGARQFYERNGFVAIEETDGSRNEEREPDVLYRWEKRQKA